MEFSKKETTLIVLKMEDDVNHFYNGDNLNFFQNLRQSQSFCKMEDDQHFFK